MIFCRIPDQTNISWFWDRPAFPIFRRSEPKYVQTEIRTMDLTIKCRTKNRIFKIKATHNKPRFNFSNVCFQYIYHRFSDSHCLVMCRCDVVWFSTSPVLCKYRCSCVKSSKVVSISKMNFISSQKVKTAKLRKT